jgi:hypothetical protein
MNRVTTRSRMRWMPTNALPNLILRMSTSRHASNYFAVDSPMACPSRPVLRYLKTFIPKHTKLLEPLDRRDRNGGLLLLNHHLQAHLLVRQETGVDDLLRSILHLSHQIHMINESPLEVPSLHHHVLPVQDKTSK